MRFVVQEHHASSLHWDLRLEKDGTFKSWCLPKGMPTEPGVQRLAIQTPDHSEKCALFEGTIEEGYGAGEVTMWDKGEYEIRSWDDDKISITLHGEKLQGDYTMRDFRGDWLVRKK